MPASSSTQSVLDRFGARNSIIFAFACHVVAVILTVFASGYTMLYVGTFVAALGNGTVETADSLLQVAGRLSSRGTLAGAAVSPPTSETHR